MRLERCFDRYFSRRQIARHFEGQEQTDLVRERTKCRRFRRPIPKMSNHVRAERMVEKM
jgi:hypothetical protein